LTWRLRLRKRDPSKRFVSSYRAVTIAFSPSSSRRLLGPCSLPLSRRRAAYEGGDGTGEGKRFGLQDSAIGEDGGSGIEGLYALEDEAVGCLGGVGVALSYEGNGVGVSRGAHARGRS